MNLMEQIFDELYDGVCISDGKGDILYLNSAAKKMMDVPDTPAETLNSCHLLCGRLFTNGSGPCQQHCPLLEEDLKENAVTFLGRHGPHSAFEWRNFGINHADHWSNLRVRCLKVSGRLLGLDDAQHHLTLIEDTAAEIELAKRKDDWRNMVAHDLISPLANIMSTLKLIQEIPTGQGLKSQEASLINRSLKSCQKVAELLNLFLDIAKLDTGTMPVHLENIGLLSLVRKCIEEQASLYETKRIGVDASMDPALVARADHELLSRVVQNLLNNAIKFTPESGQITISAAMDPEGGRVALAVKDTGTGIAPEDLPFIFDRFYQTQARREGRLQGNGLGLTFCRQAMKTMGGEIGLHSEMGNGSEFTLLLPCAHVKVPQKAQTP